MRVELRTEAREDLAEGAAFYDRQRPGLGDYFIESIFADLEALESLGAHAEIHEVVFGFHRKLISRFPFAIYYLVVGPLIDVVAVLDCRRDPAKLERRLSQTRR
jgi:plasmid stabilization system protein ParE